MPLALWSQQPPAPILTNRLVATRWVLSHGRHDSLRSVGIQVTGSNPRGQPVPAAVALINLIAAQPNPLSIFLNLNADGSQPLVPAAPDPIVASAANLPSGMTLAVLNRAAPPIEWTPLSPRFGKGNYYATVNIPQSGIVAGQELVTAKDFKNYAANSILYEAPDFGDVVMAHELEGGTTHLQCSGKVIDVAWANPMELRLFEQAQTRTDGTGGVVQILIRAELPRSFPSTRTIRWAAEAQQITLIQTINAPAVPPTGFSWFIVTLPGTTSGLVKLSAVAAEDSFPPGPFLNVGPNPPDSVVLSTFHSKTPTLEDVITMQVPPYVPKFFTWGKLFNLSPDRNQSELNAPFYPTARHAISTWFKKQGDLSVYVALQRFKDPKIARTQCDKLIAIEKRLLSEQTTAKAMILHDQPTDFAQLQYTLSPTLKEGEVQIHMSKVIARFLYKDRFVIHVEALNVNRWPPDLIKPGGTRQVSARLKSDAKKALAEMHAYSKKAVEEWESALPEINIPLPDDATGTKSNSKEKPKDI